MAYSPTTWTNEVPNTTPVKYKITDDSLGVLGNSAKIEVVTTVTPGTPVNATNLNHMETGIQNAQVAADAAQADATTGIANAATAQATANAAIPKSTVTTSQDLIVASGNAAVTRLPKGTIGGSVLHMNTAGALAWEKGIGAIVTCYNTITNGGSAWLNNFASLYANILTVNTGTYKIIIPSGLGASLPYMVIATGNIANAASGNFEVRAVSSPGPSAGIAMAFCNFFNSSVQNWSLSSVMLLSPGDEVHIEAAQNGGASKLVNATLSVFLIR